MSIHLGISSRVNAYVPCLNINLSFNWNSLPVYISSAFSSAGLKSSLLHSSFLYLELYTVPLSSSYIPISFVWGAHPIPVGWYQPQCVTVLFADQIISSQEKVSLQRHGMVKHMLPLQSCWLLLKYFALESLVQVTHTPSCHCSCLKKLVALTHHVYYGQLSLSYSVRQKCT